MENPSWVDSAKESVRKYIGMALTLTPEPEVEHSYKLIFEWSIDNGPFKRVMFSTDIGDEVMYMVTMERTKGIESVVVEPCGIGTPLWGERQ